MRERISFQVYGSRKDVMGDNGQGDMLGSFCRNDAFRCDVYSSSNFLLFLTISRLSRFFDID